MKTQRLIKLILTKNRAFVLDYATQNIIKSGRKYIAHHSGIKTFDFTKRQVREVLFSKNGSDFFTPADAGLATIDGAKFFFLVKP